MTGKGLATFGAVRRLLTHKDYAVKMVDSIIKDQCVANEGVICRFCKCQEIENIKRDQYKEAVRTLNKELTNTQAKLKEESHLREEVEKAKTNLTMQLAALHEQKDKAKVDTVEEFRVFQPFYDTCDTYYNDRFNDCLKQVGATYLNLDLSQIVIDDTVPPTFGGDDFVSDEFDDFAHMVE